MSSTAQGRLDEAQAVFDQAHTAWEEAIVARRRAEQQARSQPTLVDRSTGRPLEAQYTPRFLAEHRRLTDAEATAWQARAVAGEGVVVARQAAAAATAAAQHAAASRP